MVLGLEDLGPVNIQQLLGAQEVSRRDRVRGGGGVNIPMLITLPRERGKGRIFGCLRYRLIEYSLTYCDRHP